MREQSPYTWPRWSGDTMTVAEAQRRHSLGYPVVANGDLAAYYNAPLSKLVALEMLTVIDWGRA